MAFHQTMTDDRIVTNHDQREAMRKYHQKVNFQPPAQPAQPSGPSASTPPQRPIQTQGRTFDPPKEEGGLWIPRSRD